VSAPRFVAYETGGAREWMLARGPVEGPRLLILQPLFEEMNRCRILIADMQRALAEAGIGSWLVDLPGAGESGTALETVRFGDWRRAVIDAVAAIGGINAVTALRGGCLVDDVCDVPRWRLSPVTGASLVRDLERATPGERMRLGGYPANERLVATLADAEPLRDARTVRLNSGDADLLIEASPPWRRSEPTRDRDLAAALAADIREWLGR
jgi:hypothetical protein